MSFLAPLFLLGSLAVALPVFFHLIRRTSREQTLFSSLLFLESTPPRLTRRSRLEHLLLLALRCLVICLLSLAFARPFLMHTVPVPTGKGKRLVILVDASASMRRPQLWTAARERAESLLHAATPNDQVAVFAFDQHVTPLVSWEQWSLAAPGERPSIAAHKLADLQPGWAATHLGQALMQAAETLADSPGEPESGPREIALISDFQEGANLESLQGYEWPKGIKVVPYPLQAKLTGNAALSWLAEDEGNETANAGAVRLRVSNTTGSRSEQFRLSWMTPATGQRTGRPVDIYVPAGQSRQVTLALPSAGEKPQSVRLEGDEAEFDNTVFCIPPEAEQHTVGFNGSDREDDPAQLLYFLQRAFQKTPRQAVQVRVCPPNAPFSPTEATASLWVITEPCSAERLRALREQAENGKTLLYVVTSEAAGPSLSALIGTAPVTVKEAQLDRYAMLGDIDFRHPLFTAFADPRFSDFTKIHFWKYWRLSPTALPGAQVLARFDTGDPALVEVPLGKGRVLILTSSWRPSDSQLALSSKFLPLMYSLLETSSAVRPSARQYAVGDIVRLESWLGSTPSAATIRTPEGKEIRLSAADKTFSETQVPGIYTITSTQPPKRFAVNLAPAESRTTPISIDELERLGVPLAQPVDLARSGVTPESRLRDTELEGRQRFWRWCIVATLALVVLETGLAGRTANRLLRPNLAG